MMIHDEALHILVFCIVSEQVRSRQMHQQAEFGLAAHWSYKESHSTARSLGWISGEKDVSVPLADKLEVDDASLLYAPFFAVSRNSRACVDRRVQLDPVV